MPYGGAKLEQDVMVERIHEAAEEAYELIADRLDDVDSARMALVLVVAHDLAVDGEDVAFTAAWIVKRKRD